MDFKGYGQKIKVQTLHFNQKHIWANKLKNIVIAFWFLILKELFLFTIIDWTV